MMRSPNGKGFCSRRTFLAKMGWAPLLFLPAPLCGMPRGLAFQDTEKDHDHSFPFADFHVTPHYPGRPPFEDALRFLAPGSDEYVTEKYAFEIMALLNAWGREVKATPLAHAVLAKFVDSAIETTSLVPKSERALRTGYGVDVFLRQFSTVRVFGREQFLQELKSYLAPLSQLETAEFQVVSISAFSKSPLRARINIRYDLVGRCDGSREERIGHWLTEWTRDDANGWRVLRWTASEETVSRTRGPMFLDITSPALGPTESYQKQLVHGVDWWRTSLDGACGIEVYGNNGVAVGDFDGDGFDDLYVCQPAGLPNRLYRNRGDGTFEDVTERAGVDVLDSTACALFADFENKGLQDLLVVCGSGPLLFLNQGNGKFERKHDAFKFAQPARGTFAHAALADYDGDGRLDIYFCLYSYYVGLEQYRYPSPYFDARNGPPNYLFHNEGNATFHDRTEAAGLNVENDRYSFACAWGDANGDGSPDLYVVNDFGRSNLYRNNGDGTFKAVSAEAGVADVGAGMSACWVDFDNDGKQDIYAANMWSAAGIRISEHPQFQEKDPESLRGLYRQHARGNSLYRNEGDGKFKNVSDPVGVGMGRWAWSSDFWDFDHDGYPDLYIASGYITGPETDGEAKDDLASFFWRQVVAKSPRDATPSVNYELGWNAINELIRSDNSWSGRERNVFYANNRDGTFSEVSGTVDMDFLDDSRSFALADLDHDGRLEVVLKNRSAPQVRVLRNAMKGIGNSIALRLRGVKSNRDAIGAAVTIETASHRQTKYLQAGSGFLSQHTKELFFGIGKTEGTVRASVRWRSGLTQVFEHLPVNHRIEIVEGAEDFQAKRFAVSRFLDWPRVAVQKSEPLPTAVETWLIEPLRAPDFSLPDLAERIQDLRSFRGGSVLLNFWTLTSPICREQLQIFEKYRTRLTSNGLRIIGVNVDSSFDTAIGRSEHGASVRFFAEKESLAFPNLIATREVSDIYNLVYRYLFDRRRDLPLPTSFLLDSEGMVIKVYQGAVNPTQVLEDLRLLPRTPEERMHLALPFAGTLHQDVFQRNAFTYGVAFFQHGYLEQAEASFKQVIAAKPDDPEAYYNLGTLYLRRNALSEAREHLESAVKLRPRYPEAWNNLGMIAAQDGRADEAVSNFRESLAQRPDYVTALLNLGNLYRRQGISDEADKLLTRAVELEPENPEANYSLAMFYARQEQIDRAVKYLEKAVSLRPDYPDALNNLGVLFVRTKNYSEAEDKLKTCIRVAPNFDQGYLNLARLYVILDEKEKAREILQDLLRQHPQHKVAQQTLEMLN